MRRDPAIAWAVSSRPLTLRKAPAILAAAAMRVRRASMANIGRAMAGMAKHQIARCWRSCSDERAETADAMRPIVARLLRQRKRKLPVAVGWVDIKGFQTLVASVVLQGRSVPVARASTAGHVQDRRKGRVDRMLPILAVAYLLVCGVGPIAMTPLPPSARCSTDRGNECGIYTTGMIMPEQIGASPQLALAAIAELSEFVAPNRG